MTITVAMVLLGSLFIYAGITNRSVSALIKGDNSVQNAAASTTTAPGTTGPVGTPSTATSSSGAPAGVTGPVGVAK